MTNLIHMLNENFYLIKIWIKLSHWRFEKISRIVSYCLNCLKCFNWKDEDPSKDPTRWLREYMFFQNILNSIMKSYLALTYLIQFNRHNLDDYVWISLNYAIMCGVNFRNGFLISILNFLLFTMSCRVALAEK